MKKVISASIALAFTSPLSALAQATSPQAEAQNPKQALEAQRTAYEARLQALEGRLKAIESVAPSAAPTPRPSNNNTFNPAVSLILSGTYTSTSQDPSRYRITGFQLPEGSEAGPGTRGFSLGESELSLSANIDPSWLGAANFAVHSDNSVSVEEAFVQTTSMGHGFTAKAGRFFSGVGYLNAKHAHTWDFVDSPLAYQALLGSQYSDDGVQIKWLAPVDQFIELGAEMGRGANYPGTDKNRNGAGMAALIAHVGGDLGVSHNWRAGVSMLHVKASDQGLNAMDISGTPVAQTFNGTTRVWVLDGVWKWAPDGNATRTSFKLQGEYLRSRRQGDLSQEVDGLPITEAYQRTPSGWYLQGVYQFMPRWRAGLRAERLNAGIPNEGSLAASLSSGGYRPRKNSVMLDFNPSEFSKWRLQLSQDRSQQGLSDQQVFVQYQMSLGAHGAHSY